MASDNDDVLSLRAARVQWEKKQAEREAKARMEQDLRYGMQLARSFFEKRGKGRVEVHLSETELAALLAMAFGHGREMPR